MKVYAPLDMQGNRVQDLGDPEVDEDAANKGFVTGYVGSYVEQYITGATIVGVVTSERLAGTLDGVNDTFTTANPYRFGTTVVYRNGLREFRNVGYLELDDRTIQFTTVPRDDDDLFIDYLILDT